MTRFLPAAPMVAPFLVGLSLLHLAEHLEGALRRDCLRRAWPPHDHQRHAALCRRSGITVP